MIKRISLLTFGAVLSLIFGMFLGRAGSINTVNYLADSAMADAVADPGCSGYDPGCGCGGSGGGGGCCGGGSSC